jgi:hypothetical protein
MTISGSGLYVATEVDIKDATQLQANYVGGANKAAIFTNGLTPNFDTDQSYGVAPYNANELAGTGYTAGGQVLAGQAFGLFTAGVIRYTHNPITWNPATWGTVNGARALVYYLDALSPKRLYFLWDFGQDHDAGGIFTVTPPPEGCYQIHI